MKYKHSTTGAIKVPKIPGSKRKLKIYLKGLDKEIT